MSAKRIFMNRTRSAAVLVLLLGLSAPLYSQRTYNVNGTIDVVGGFDSYPPSTGVPTGGDVPTDPFYGVLPGISLQSRTARTVLNATYGFGLNHYASELPRDSKSHSASLSLSRDLGPRWTFTVTDWFSRTDDLFTYYALLGVELVDEDLVLYFSPVAANQTLTTNRVGASFSHQLSPRSSITFGGEHGLGYYGNDADLVGLSDQNQFSGNFGYSRRITDRTSLTVSYNAGYFAFDKFNSAVSNAVTAGLSSIIAKDTTVSLSVGPSHVRNIEVNVDNLSYQASASLTKAIKGNSFHFTLSQGNATTSGVGTISSTRSASAGISRTFGRRVSVFADASAFQGTGIIGNPFNTKGTTITGNVGLAIARNLSLQTGVQFQRYMQPSPYAFTQKRLFASLRYTQPNLLRSR